MGKPLSVGIRSVLNRVFKTVLRNSSGNVVLITARAKAMQRLPSGGLRLRAALMSVRQLCVPLRLRVLQRFVPQACEVLQLHEVQPLEALLIRCLALT